jgi:hypothetical protein
MELYGTIRWGFQTLAPPQLNEDFTAPSFLTLCVCVCVQRADFSVLEF